MTQSNNINSNNIFSLFPPYSLEQANTAIKKEKTPIKVNSIKNETKKDSIEIKSNNIKKIIAKRKK